MTIETIEKIHSLIIEDGGEIRSNYVGIRHPKSGAVETIITPKNIAENLKTLLESINRHPPVIPPLILATQFKLAIVRIHPFRDGNGRLSRLLFNWMARKKGFQVWTTFPADEVNE